MCVCVCVCFYSSFGYVNQECVSLQRGGCFVVNLQVGVSGNLCVIILISLACPDS